MSMLKHSPAKAKRKMQGAVSSAGAFRFKATRDEPTPLDSKRSRATKKTPSQLNREIDKLTIAKSSPRVAYRLQLSPSEVQAVEFARGHYSWPDMLAAHMMEDGLVAFTEPEMWQWTDDVDSDTSGGDSSFPLASPALADKLQRFYDEKI